VTYSARDVAQILGLQESRVRYWAQTGFVGPSAREGGRAVYTFPDLVSVKAAKELLDRGVSVQRARKSLEALRAQLPALEQPLARLRVLGDGERVVCAGDAAPFEPLSGQLLMDFAVDELQARVGELRDLRPAEPPRARAVESAYAWFLEGVALDGSDEDRALIAYHKAIDGDPLLAAAHTNLGALLHRRGERAEARARFETALSLDPEQPEARYNLANLYDELGERERALAEWHRVVAECPEFADAHFNLAVALYGDGARDTAALHLRRYLALDGAGEWAERARALLDTI
jgi:tetratricopeptide (TPR) repeat protein